MQEISQETKHSLTLVAREKLEISGVSDVKGFNEETISVITDRGNLIVKGENLHISRLSLEKGEVSLDGKVNSLQYMGDAPQKGVFARIFK